MKYNTYSYVLSDENTIKQDLASIGFVVDKTDDPQLFQRFIYFIHHKTPNVDWALRQLIADAETDLLSFLQSGKPLTAEIFYTLALQLLSFIPGVDYQLAQQADFLTQIKFPIQFGNLLDNLYQLLNLRRKTGNTLIDTLVAEGLIPEDNHYHYFNGKSLATFNTHDLIREVVYVESPVDTDGDGLLDLIRVNILRPKTSEKLPVIMTQSPYHMGVNETANDQQLHQMASQLQVKAPQQIQVKPTQTDYGQAPHREVPEGQATEKLGHMGFYTLNDYLLARGFANLYVSGVGTLGSDGFMTSGDYQQVAGFKAVIDWLNGRAQAFTDPHRQTQVKANWTNGKVATTGISYLGTMSNALATTGVEGLEVVIAEAGISAWYDYYREKGLVVSPGGYPGEDLDVLTAFTASQRLQAGHVLRHEENYRRLLDAQTQAIDRATGDYNQYWHDRNYLPQAHQVKCQMVFTHGTQDWNVKPIHVYQMFQALPDTVKKHLFLHHGAHVYMNNWQSIDFRESMNTLLTQRLLGLDNGYDLPAVIWQDNRAAQSWQTLTDFGGQHQLTLPLGHGQKIIHNQYDEATFARYSQTYQTFKEDLYADKAQQVTVDLTLPQALHLNGRLRLQLKVKSSTNKGLISAQILDLGDQKRLTPAPEPISPRTLDNGRYFSIDNLMELPLKPTPHRLLSTGHLNLQNRYDLLTVESVPADEWLTLTFDLQPTIYALEAGATLRVILYTTDFEHTVRDNSDWTLTVDLEHSQLVLPHD